MTEKRCNNSLKQKSHNLTMGVPTVWLNLLQFLEESGKTVPTLKEWLLEVQLALHLTDMQEKHGVYVHCMGHDGNEPMGLTADSKTEWTILRAMNFLEMSSKLDEVFTVLR